METIVDGVTGLFFDQQTVGSLGDAIERFEQRDWSPSAIRRHSENFSTDVFQDRFRSFFRRIGAPVETPDRRSVATFAEAFQRERAS